MTVKILLSCASAVCALLAAGLWASASKTPPDPPVGAFAEAVMPALHDYRIATRRAAQMNRRAAILSCLAAVLTLSSIFF